MVTMEIKCVKQLNMVESISNLGSRHRYFLEGEVAEVLHAKYKVVHEKDIIVKSDTRTHVVCPIFYECGGCDLLHIKYNEQLKMKQTYVSDLFTKEKLFVKINPISESKSPKHYRHKVVLSATHVKDKLRLGLYRENSKEVIPYLFCHIQDEEINKLLKTVEDVLNRYKITGYHIDKETGIIKHIMVRKSYQTQEMMLLCVTNGTLFPNAKKIAHDIIAKHPMVKTVIQNIHRKKTHLVLLDEEKIIYGSGFITDMIDDVKFKLSPKSFYQVNPVQMIELYQKAISLSEISKDDIVMDTYSGVGTISLLAAKKAKHVIAIETNKQAHIDAIVNKKMNQMNNITFVNSPVEDYIKSYHDKIDCLIMDPTRDGSSKEFLEAVKRLKPKRITYISCNPETQVRDLKELIDMYQIKNIQPVDMFSQTVHVENIVLLSLKTA
jgi:23S rRNA (uracil1939-C5)-methyltransferase